MRNLRRGILRSRVRDDIAGAPLERAGRRGPIARLSLALALALAPSYASAASRAEADDLAHPLVPSTRAIERGTLLDSGMPAGTAAPVRASRPTLVREGAILYATHCTSCHGTDLRGSRDVPSLLDSGGSAMDFYMTTGRMPLAVPQTQAYHQPAHFDAREIAALDAYVDGRARKSTAIPSVRVTSTTLVHGRRLFEDNCQACHGVAGEGATAGEQWTALPLDLATPTQIGEAIRVGPGVMPRFGARQLTDADISAVATYVVYLRTAPQTYGGSTLGFVGPAAEGFVGAIFGVGVLFLVIFYTGTKADGRRVHEFDRAPAPDA